MTSSTRPRKGLAITAAGAVLAIGTLTTLAAWNDNEWVVGAVDGNGDGEGVGTSTFKVQQSREQAPDQSDDFEDRASKEEAGGLEFSVGSLALAPGQTIYAPVALRTVANSVAGTVELQQPVPYVDPASGDAEGLLWGALTYSVRTDADRLGCTNAGDFAAFDTAVVTDKHFTEPAGASTQDLTADQGAIQYYCFAITLPENPTLPVGTPVEALQGRTVAPAWRFASESVVPSP